MSGARILPIVNADGQFYETAPFILLAHMLFPNDAYSAQTLIEILKTQESHDSHIAQILATSLNGEKMQAKSAGELVRLLAELSAHGFPVTQNRAVALAAKFGGDTDDKLKAGHPTSTSTILTHFRKYKDVAHLWAAAGHVGSAFIKHFDSMEGLETLLAIADKYQKCMAEDLQQPVADWNPWQVPKQFARPELALGIRRWNQEFLDAATAYRRRGGN